MKIELLNIATFGLAYYSNKKTLSNLLKVGVVFQFFARPFISRRHVELCESCFLVSFFSNHRRSGIDM